MEYKKLILFALVILVNVLSVSSYTPANYTSIDSTLRGGYVADNYSNINLVLGEGETTPEYPQFSNYWDNNGSLIGNGIGHFNVVVSSTNGTVVLEINNTNITATNLSSNVCYQEFVNISTSCGGLNTGGYKPALASDYINGSYLFDGDWNTYGVCEGSCDVFINYTKPIGIMDNNLWQIKDGLNTINLTIPSDCWDYNINTIYLRVISNNAIPATWWYCSNSTAYKILRTASTTLLMYEEAMIWNISVYNVSYNFTSAGTYAYRWHSWGNGTAHNYNRSAERNYTVKTSDTCTYTSGNWFVNMADYCNITSNVNGGGNNLTFNGSGQFTLLSANVTNFYRRIFPAQTGWKIVSCKGCRFD